MASKGINFRRGSTGQHVNFKGGLAELTVDTDKKVVIVHDDAKLGGYELVGTAVTQTLSNKEFSGVTTFTDLNSLGVSSVTNLKVTGVSTFVGVSTFNGIVGFGTTTLFADTVKAQFGQSGDLEIYHDPDFLSGTGGSFIRDVGSGDLYIDSDRIHLRTGVGTDKVVCGTGVSLSYGNTKRFATSGTGATVYGTLDSTELTVTGFSTLGIVTTTAIHIASGSGSTAPIKVGIGTTLDTWTLGTIEYDGSAFYATPNNSGRGVIQVNNNYVLQTNAAAVGPGTSDFFPSPSSLFLEANSTYVVEYGIYFTKTTAGLGTFSFLFSQVPTAVHATWRLNNNINTQAALTGAGVYNISNTIVNLPITASITTGVNHYANLRAVVVTGANSTNMRLRVGFSAGTATPLAGSAWSGTKMTGNNGLYIA